MRGGQGEAKGKVGVGIWGDRVCKDTYIEGMAHVNHNKLKSENKSIVILWRSRSRRLEIEEVRYSGYLFSSLSIHKCIPPRLRLEREREAIVRKSSPYCWTPRENKCLEADDSPELFVRGTSQTWGGSNKSHGTADLYLCTNTTWSLNTPMYVETINW